MDEFAQSLERDHLPEWSDHYLDYHSLQDKVEAATASNQDEATAEHHKNLVETALDKDIRKILAFYRKHESAVQRDMQDLKDSHKVLHERMSDSHTDDTSKRNSWQQHLQKLQQHGEHVSNLLQYVSLNVRGTRKVLNKLDRGTSDTPQKPKDGCMALEVERPHHPGSTTFQSTSLPKEVAEQLDDMFEHKPLGAAADTIKHQYEQLQKWQAKLGQMEHEPNQQMDNVMRRLGRSEYWAQRNTDLVHTISKGERWAGIYEDAPDDERASGGWLGLAVNCACAALYMANYQLILPDVETYLEHIGAASSWSGIVIGCCDVATLPGAIGYSLWTNRSFKMPLLAAALVCIFGNVLYAVGYDVKTLWILSASRLLVGFGSARTVNRRYIADFISKDQRTKASAAFVTSSAVGMACGPLLALPLSYLPKTSVGPISIDPVTAGGWIMGLLWLLFLVLTLFFFAEPMSGDEGDESSDDEEQPLMAEADHSDEEEGSGRKSQSGDSEGKEREGSFKQHLPATILMFCILFLVKLVQQGFLSSLSTFTSKLYGWSSSQSGMTLAVYGFALIPLNIAVGKASNSVSDRSFSAVLLGTITLGSGLCICSGKPMWLFFLGGACVFMGSMTLEGSAMSLLSKVMHPSLAEGTFNTGLLTTEAGGIGRLGGNLAISAFSKLTGQETSAQVYSFGHYLFGLLTLVTLGSSAYFGSMWNRVSD